MCDKCAAEDVKMSAANVFQQCYNSRNEQSVCTDNGECKLEEPPSVNNKVDIKQISKHGSKTAGNKNNGVGPFEPKRERNELIKQQHCTDCVAGPFRGIADADVADNKLNDQRGKIMVTMNIIPLRFMRGSRSLYSGNGGSVVLISISG